MKARIHITLKEGVLDPQGKAIQFALGDLGFPNVDNVRQGKYIEIDQMCKKLLSNTVIENYTIDLDD